MLLEPVFRHCHQVRRVGALIPISKGQVGEDLRCPFSGIFSQNERICHSNTEMLKVQDIMICFNHKLSRLFVQSVGSRLIRITTSQRSCKEQRFLPVIAATSIKPPSSALSSALSPFRSRLLRSQPYALLCRLNIGIRTPPLLTCLFYAYTIFHFLHLPL